MKASACVIGIMGGIASGKSALAQEFARLGAKIVDADRIGHRVLERADVRKKVQQVWGDAVLSPEGAVDRSRLGEIVFRDQAELRKLSEIVHPLILRDLDREVRESEVPVVLDAALLDEFSLTSRCDHLVFVDAQDRIRRERAVRERRWSPDEMEKREAFQNPKESKRRKAQHIVENNGDLSELRERARRVWLAIGLGVPDSPTPAD